MSLINKKEIAGQILSRKQLQSRLDFLACAKFAEKAMSDEQLRILYELFCSKNKSPYYTAFDDARNAPIITEIDLVNYTGKRKSVIVVRATDDFQVEKVKVEIFDPKGNYMEGGQAEMNEKINAWVYFTKSLKYNITGVQVKISAYDIPGNRTTMTKIVE